MPEKTLWAESCGRCQSHAHRIVAFSIVSGEHSYGKDTTYLRLVEEVARPVQRTEG